MPTRNLPWPLSSPGIYAAGGAALFANELVVDGNATASAGGGIMASDNACVATVRDYPGALVLHAISRK